MKENPKILVIGSKGGLGSQILAACSEHDVTGWDRDEIDVTSEQEVWDKVTAFRPDLVFNCAAFTDVDKAEEERALAESLNAYAPGYLAKACKSLGATMVHYGTGMVFDGNNPAGYSEDDPPHPVNAYGRSKLAGELEALENLDDLYVIRTCWLFGPAGTGATNKRSFIDAIVAKAAGGEISIVEDESGSPTYSVDLAQASLALVEMGKPFGTYHITNSGTVSRLDWAKEVFAIKGMTPKVTAIKGNSLARMAKRPHFEVLVNTKFIQMRPWAEALKEYLR